MPPIKVKKEEKKKICFVHRGEKFETTKLWVSFIWSKNKNKNVKMTKQLIYACILFDQMPTYSFCTHTFSKLSIQRNPFRIKSSVSALCFAYSLWLIHLGTEFQLCWHPNQCQFIWLFDEPTKAITKKSCCAWLLSHACILSSSGLFRRNSVIGTDVGMKRKNKKKNPSVLFKFVRLPKSEHNRNAIIIVYLYLCLLDQQIYAANGFNSTATQHTMKPTKRIWIKKK